MPRSRSGNSNSDSNKGQREHKGDMRIFQPQRLPQVGHQPPLQDAETIQPESFEFK